MDRPNYELAWYLAEQQGAEVHLVSHRVASPLSDHSNVIWHRVPRPFGRDTFGSPFLDGVGRKIAREISSVGGTVVVNGGNCLWNDVNWIHYVHNTPMAERGRPSLPHREWMRWKRQARSTSGTAGRRRVALDHHRFGIDEGSPDRRHFGRPGARADDLLRDRSRQVPSCQCRRAE